ncbi:hypothetical protein LTR56_013846 [Elasticomyces elasticus]|nr:hypothetical protein LTR56_013846 [Elasticomyces elasticus]KAK3660549.1 hypothetical protein LTR22_007990 [Elasticomyces elasticus]KAK4923837.1 hypothetical protein LTR49_008985 [Elasticomyces elasticus]KAK5751980.1 hypothetical protein LTS12_017913 [Elasticomyces elasticus]
MANGSMLPACITTTLNLPVEFLFDDMVAPPKYIWEKLPNDMEFWPSRFTNYERYIGLLRISEQIYKEAKSLLLSTYASRLTFDFSVAVELVEFIDRDYNPDHAVLGNAQFLLYTDRNPHEAADMQPIVEAAKYMWKQQPGFNRDWEWLAGYYGENIDMTDGFELLAGGYDYCSSPKECAPYRVLKWPFFGNGCHLVGYQCKKSDLLSSVRQSGHDKELHCVVFQGRFRDFRLGQFDRPDRAEDLARARWVKRFDGLDEDGVSFDDEEEDEEDGDEGEDDIFESEVSDEESDDDDEAEASGDDSESADGYASPSKS